MSPETDRAASESLWTPHVLVAIRARRNRRLSALVAVALVGLVAVWVHWVGLFVAGALIGLVSWTVPRAAAAGLGFGLLVLLLHIFASPVMGPAEFLALSPPSYVTIAAALIGPLWGSLVRGVV